MLRKFVLFSVLLPIWALAAPTPPTPLEQDRYRFPSMVATHGMVVSAEPLASKAGTEVLQRGGNAVDAAVVTALALAVTLPRAGNIGGGGFLLVREPNGKVHALDFRERAPARSTPEMLQDDKGNRDPEKATVGGLSVGVPGTVAGLEMALQRFGTISWKEAVEPARRLAADGFVVPHWLTLEVARVRQGLERFPDSRKVFFVDGQPLPRGSVWKQPDLARSLSLIQSQGSKGFYQGPLAEQLVTSVQLHGGIMEMRDLASYRAVWREPIEGDYRGYRISSMPPPSSGGVHLIQALNVLEGYDLVRSRLNSALTLHRLIEALRQCYADRSHWLGDPDFVRVPVGWLISKDYARQIREQIPERRARLSDQLKPGKPAREEGPQTTHFCVVDREGWAVSLTYTLNFSYGSGLVAEGTGILLNNEIDDFSAAPNKPNAFGLLGGTANAIEPGKRPLSSMTPTIVQKEGQLVAVVGSPGGSRIITVVLQVILNLIDFDLNAQSAVAEARLHHQWYPDRVEVEQGFSPDTLDLLRSWGHNVLQTDSLGHAMVIRRLPDGTLEAGADPRRTGGAAEGY